MLSFLESLAPELNEDAVLATPPSLKDWCAHRGPRANVAAFFDDGAAEPASEPSALPELMHIEGPRTAVRLFMVQEAC